MSCSISSDVIVFLKYFCHFFTLNHALIFPQFISLTFEIDEYDQPTKGRCRVCYHCTICINTPANLKKIKHFTKRTMVHLRAPKIENGFRGPGKHHFFYLKILEKGASLLPFFQKISKIFQKFVCPNFH